MNDIEEILQIKGELPYLKVSDGLVIEGGGEYRGYWYLVTFSYMYRCGYVEIPRGHPVDSDDYDYMKDDPHLFVHGGVTFLDSRHAIKSLLDIDTDDKWIGFDSGHSLDIFDIEAVKKYGTVENPEELEIPKCEPGYITNVLKDEFPSIVNWAYKVRDYEYMESECKRLIDQLIEMEGEE